MRENRPSGSEAGVALIPPSLPYQTLREIGGAMRGRGSAWSAAACRRCVCLGPGWNPALHKHRAADESSQNRPFLLTRTRLPRRPALEGRVPPRPLARVEPSPPPNRNHRPGV